MKQLVSLIICTYSRPEPLQTALRSIMEQKSMSFDLEIILVDNSPTGQMKSALEPFGNGVRYVQEPTQGKSHALNLGITESKGEIIAFTDDDVIADPQWLSTLIGCINRHQCDGAGGRVLPIYPENTPQWIKDNPNKIAGGVVIHDCGDGEFVYDSRRHYRFIGCNYAFRREVFDSCGLFRTDVGPGTPAMGEDSELIERLAANGKVLYYCGQAVIRHPVDLKRLTLSHMAKWHIALGRFAARREIEKKEKIDVYYFHVPRYIWKGILINACEGIFYLFNRIKFLDAWRGFFRKIGMIEEYRHQYKENQAVGAKRNA
jgi:GT2 family glycosyltransferase